MKLLLKYWKMSIPWGCNQTQRFAVKKKTTTKYSWKYWTIKRETHLSFCDTAQTELFLWQNRNTACNIQRPTVYKDGFRIIIFSIQIVPMAKSLFYLIWMWRQQKHLSEEGNETILQLFLTWFEPEESRTFIHPPNHSRNAILQQHNPTKPKH